MALTETNKIETNKFELTVQVGPEEFEKALERAYRKNVKRINVPGFRKGKAPRKMVEKLYGEGVFFEDAINELYPDALADAIKEAKLEVVARPQVEAREVAKDKGFTFVATCVVKPEVTVGEYKGIEVEKKVKTVTDEDVAKRIDAMRGRNARLLDITDRPAQKGDSVTFDFDGSVDGVPFDGGKAEKFNLELGSGQFIPGFEEQVENHAIGEEFDVNVTFPEDYHAEELKGKAAVFRCKIHEIKAKELPELDDEFAKDVSEFDTLEELRNDIRGKMTEQAEKAAADGVENQLIDKVIEGMQAEIPQEMNEARIDDMVRDFQYRLQSQGLNIDAYLQYTGMDPAAFRQTFEEQAKKQVKIRLALEKIVELENIVPSDEDLEEEYKKIAEGYKMSAEEIKKVIPHEDFVKDMSVNKAIELIKNTAKITETTAE
ncbi:MAG: trigger factor [Oscillospiraceae bacterium]|jgi:trigger factor|nr:trigger factor [Oscillospiraceae bacterium]